MSWRRRTWSGCTSRRTLATCLTGRCGGGALVLLKFLNHRGHRGTQRRTSGSSLCSSVSSVVNALAEPASRQLGRDSAGSTVELTARTRHGQQANETRIAPSSRKLLAPMTLARGACTCGEQSALVRASPRLVRDRTSTVKPARAAAHVARAIESSATAPIICTTWPSCAKHGSPSAHPHQRHPAEQQQRPADAQQRYGVARHAEPAVVLDDRRGDELARDDEAEEERGPEP